MERLFGLSGLAQRQKWGRADYRRRTIAKALAGRPGVLLTRTNQPTRSMQDEPGVINTGAAGLPATALSLAREREAVKVMAALVAAEEQDQDEGWLTLLTRTNQPTRSMQGEQGVINTGAAGPPGASRSPAREREAVEVAAALADAERQGEDWRVTFTLARRLRARLAGAGGECGAVRPVDHGPRPSQRRGPRPGPPGRRGGPARATPRRPGGQ